MSTGTLQTVIDFLKADAGLKALVSDRVYLELPRTNKVFPCVTVLRMPGGTSSPDMPIDQPRLDVRCWGETYSQREAVYQQIRKYNGAGGFAVGASTILAIDEQQAGADQLAEISESTYWEFIGATYSVAIATE